MWDGRQGEESGEDRLPSPGEITGLLEEWAHGEPDALEELLQTVYLQLRYLAESRLRRERPGHTLQATELLHEAYLRLAEQRHAQWQNRTHFFAVAARIMRRILIDHARARHRLKRGGGGERVSLAQAPGVWDGRDEELLALDAALGRLSELDAQQARVVELRFFGGLTVEETAEAMNISPRTVKREWSMARAWLTRELRHSE
jgi:RNA polymerase sigma factor (TIGR02999 family)